MAGKDLRREIVDTEQGRELFREFAGALLRPHGPALKPMKNMGLPVEDVFKAAEDAGVQLIREGKISAETLKVISRELLPLEVYVENVNKGFEQALASQ